MGDFLKAVGVVSCGLLMLLCAIGFVTLVTGVQYSDTDLRAFCLKNKITLEKCVITAAPTE